MKYDIYDREYSYGIPSHTAIDEQEMFLLVLTKPHLIVVETGKQCPPINVNLQDIYADIQARLRHADKTIKYRAHQNYEHTTDI
jgi:hypothetical protein